MQSVVVRQSTVNNVSSHYLIFLVLLFFLCHDLFKEKECSDQKTYLVKVVQRARQCGIAGGERVPLADVEIVGQPGSLAARNHLSWQK